MPSLPRTRGFLRRLDSTESLSSGHFPSKVSGKPAWLDLQCIPHADSLRCRSCEEIMHFLLQIYAPMESVRDDTYHRTLFVFVCDSPTCASDPNRFRVLRSQLAEENEFYSMEDVDLDTGYAALRSACCPLPPVCPVCGYRLEHGSGRAAEESSSPSFCPHCDQAVKSVSESVQCFFGPEQEIETDCDSSSCCSVEKDGQEGSIDDDEGEYDSDEEECSDDQKDEGNEKGDKILGESIGSMDMIRSELERIGRENQGLDTSLTLTELDAFFSNSDAHDDPAFSKFMLDSLHHPGQVIVYHREGEPLSVTSTPAVEFQPPPPCPLCGSDRVFEFQILPQLLSEIHIEQRLTPIDFGSVLIFTCKNCCSVSEYVEEYAFVQDYCSPSTVPREGSLVSSIPEVCSTSSS